MRRAQGHAETAEDHVAAHHLCDLHALKEGAWPRPSHLAETGPFVNYLVGERGPKHYPRAAARG